jgi:hypothetical protein
MIRTNSHPFFCKRDTFSLFSILNLPFICSNTQSPSWIGWLLRYFYFTENSGFVSTVIIFLPHIYDSTLTWTITSRNITAATSGAGTVHSSRAPILWCIRVAHLRVSVFVCVDYCLSSSLSSCMRRICVLVTSWYRVPFLHQLRPLFFR